MNNDYITRVCKTFVKLARGEKKLVDSNHNQLRAALAISVWDLDLDVGSPGEVLRGRSLAKKFLDNIVIPEVRDEPDISEIDFESDIDFDSDN